MNFSELYNENKKLETLEEAQTIGNLFRKLWGSEKRAVAQNSFKYNYVLSEQGFDSMMDLLVEDYKNYGSQGKQPPKRKIWVTKSYQAKPFAPSLGWIKNIGGNKEANAIWSGVEKTNYGVMFKLNGPLGMFKDADIVLYSVQITQEAIDGNEDESQKSNYSTWIKGADGKPFKIQYIMSINDKGVKTFKELTGMHLVYFLDKAKRGVNKNTATDALKALMTMNYPSWFGKREVPAQPAPEAGKAAPEQAQTKAAPQAQAQAQTNASTSAAPAPATETKPATPAAKTGGVAKTADLIAKHKLDANKAISIPADKIAKLIGATNESVQSIGMILTEDQMNEINNSIFDTLKDYIVDKESFKDDEEKSFNMVIRVADPKAKADPNFNPDKALLGKIMISNVGGEYKMYYNNAARNILLKTNIVTKDANTTPAPEPTAEPAAEEKPAEATPATEPTAEAKPANEGFVVGAKVKHKTFGEGVIESVEDATDIKTNTDYKKVTIKFPKNVTKTLKLDIAIKNGLELI